MSFRVRHSGSVNRGIVGQTFSSFAGGGFTVFNSGSSEDLPSLEPIDITPDMSVIMNGHVIRGRNVSMVNGVIYVDGKRYDPNAPNAGDVATPGVYRELKIEITGNVRGDIRTTSGDVTVTGDSGAIKTMSGDAEVSGNVSGSVSTMSGDVKVMGELGGSASSMSGDVRTGNKKKRGRE